MGAYQNSYPSSSSEHRIITQPTKGIPLARGRSATGTANFKPIARSAQVVADGTGGGSPSGITFPTASQVTGSSFSDRERNVAPMQFNDDGFLGAQNAGFFESALYGMSSRLQSVTRFTSEDAP